MAELDNNWWNDFGGSFDTEEEVFEFIFERVDTSDFEDSYIDMGGHHEPNECFKRTASEKRELLYDFMMQVLKEVQQFRAIGTVEECREAVEKQRAKKSVTYKRTNRADCPVCSVTVRGIGKPFGSWCAGCGQKLDWSEEE